MPGREPAIDVVAIVASAGGLDAISAVLRALPADLPVAVVVQQHLGGPSSILARILERRTGRVVGWAEDGTRLVPGSILVAPARRPMTVLRDGTCALGPEIQTGILDRPHDGLLTSLAETFGPRALAVVLTGMGKDGARGVRALVDAGGTVIAQDVESAREPSMPRAAAAAGAAPVLPLLEIGAVVAAVVRRGPLPDPAGEGAGVG